MTALRSHRAAAPAELQAAALAWYDANGRDLAFRRSADPWSVLVSEVMAQQTQAARAAEAWATFIERYPNPAALAVVSVAEAIRAWRGLGYNRRAVALRAAAIRIVEDHQGRVPDSLDDLEALPGVGPYTARAVVAIAFGGPVAALDTNVRRVLDRTVGPLPSEARQRQATADRFVSADRSAAWTHALMDIGATICRKRDPRCDSCPLAEHCVALRSGGPPETGARAGTTRAAQQPFETTSRWLRGRIVDLLRDAPNGRWQVIASPLGQHEEDAVNAALAGLARDGLVELDSSRPGRARLAHGVPSQEMVSRCNGSSHCAVVSRIASSNRVATTTDRAMRSNH